MDGLYYGLSIILIGFLSCLIGYFIFTLEDDFVKQKRKSSYIIQEKIKNEEDMNPRPESTQQKNYGDKYLREGEWAKAIAEYTRVIILHPDDLSSAKYYRNRGRAFQELGALDVALIDYNKAVAIDPEYGLAYYSRGKLFLKNEQYELAKFNLKAAKKWNADYENIYYELGMVYKIQSMYDKALDNFNQAIQTNNEFTPAYIKRAEIYKSKKEYSQAISDYTKVIELNPKSISAYFHRASIYQIQNENNLAANDLRKVLELAEPVSIYHVRAKNELAKLAPNIPLRKTLTEKVSPPTLPPRNINKKLKDQHSQPLDFQQTVNERIEEVGAPHMIDDENLSSSQAVKEKLNTPEVRKEFVDTVHSIIFNLSYWNKAQSDQSLFNKSGFKEISGMRKLFNEVVKKTHLSEDEKNTEILKVLFDYTTGIKIPNKIGSVKNVCDGISELDMKALKQFVDKMGGNEVDVSVKTPGKYKRDL